MSTTKPKVLSIHPRLNARQLDMTGLMRELNDLPIRSYYTYAGIRYRVPTIYAVMAEHIGVGSNLSLRTLFAEVRRRESAESDAGLTCAW